jgi:hypothetical protein
MRLCKLESVTWNPGTEELSWVISTRDLDGGPEQPVVQERYTIHVDTAIMDFKGEGRRFDANEARQVGAIMNVISKYTVESTVWWANGEGEKLDKDHAAPPRNPDKKEPNRNKEERDREETPKPTPRVGVPLAYRPDLPAETSLWQPQLLPLQLPKH